MELISGLPDDVALECLIRTHYSDFSSMSSVCKSWKRQIQLPEFLRHRKAAGKSRVVVAMAQAVHDPDRVRSQKSYGSPPAYRVTLFEPETGDWSEIPPPPSYSHGLPLFCRLAGVGSELVVMGGWDPKTFGVSRCVFVYSFVTATWRRGADMPEPARSFFGCAADGVRRTVYVAGGHDGGKNALRSVLAYDVAKDEWMEVGDMASERDECHAVVHRGKLHVIGGYCSDMQGRFEKSAEIFDLEGMQWESEIGEFLDGATCHKACTAYGSDLYTCRKGHVAVRDGERKWENAVEMPGGIGEVAYVAGWGEKMVVIGTSNKGDTSSGYIVDLKSMKWSQVAMPEKYSGNIQAGCCLET
uniref:F-box domain-containing protein n=1 Tax=Kalanchoe fedtschenkoi TaxID=63787 RepID=A0A7N0TRU4_KALFE